MADEIMEAIQILRFGYDGLRLGVDVTGSTVREAKNLVIFIVGLLNHEKLQGKTSLKNMLKKDGNLQVVQIKESDVKQFEKLAKKYGILYSKMPDINKGDGMTEYLFPAEATQRINAILEKLGVGRVEDISDYVRNGEGSFEDTLEYLTKHKLIPEGVEITPKRAEELMDMTRNIKYNEGINDLSKADITISKELVKSEKENSFVTRVPGTFGDDVRFIEVKKEDIIVINHGKTYLTFLEKDKEYELLDKNQKPVQKIKGEELINTNYSKVQSELREKAIEKARAEKKQKDRKEQTGRKEEKHRKEQSGKKEQKNRTEKSSRKEQIIKVEVPSHGKTR